MSYYVDGNPVGEVYVVVGSEDDRHEGFATVEGVFETDAGAVDYLERFICGLLDSYRYTFVEEPSPERAWALATHEPCPLDHYRWTSGGDPRERFGYHIERWEVG